MGAARPPLSVNPMPRYGGRQALVTSGFGPRTGGMYDTHYGVDMLYPGRPGEPTKSPEGVAASGRHYVVPSGRVYALAAGDGEVKKAGWTQTGDRVQIAHDDVWSTGYMHLRGSMVRVGQRVRAGDPLGLVSFSPYVAGCTSTPTAPCKTGLNHTHFELYKSGTAVDPEAWLGRHLGSLEVRPNPGALWPFVLAGFVAWGAYQLLR